MNHNPCEHGPDALAFLDGELDSGARQAFETHLEGCPVCREELAQFAKVAHDLARLPVRPAPASFRKRFFENFEQTFGPLHPGRPGVNRESSWWGSWLRPRWLVLAGASAAFAVALLLWQPGGSRPNQAEQDLMIAHHLEFFEDYEVIARLDLLEDLDAILSLEDGT